MYYGQEAGLARIPSLGTLRTHYLDDVVVEIR